MKAGDSQTEHRSESPAERGRGGGALSLPLSLRGACASHTHEDNDSDSQGWSREKAECGVVGGQVSRQADRAQEDREAQAHAEKSIPRCKGAQSQLTLQRRCDMQPDGQSHPHTG